MDWICRGDWLPTPAARPAVKIFFERLGYSFSDNFTVLTAAQFVLMNGCGFLASAFPAYIAAELLAGDVGNGIMRLVLCRPISRLRILGTKLAASAIYLASLTTVSVLGALAIASLFEPWGPMLVECEEFSKKKAGHGKEGSEQASQTKNQP